MAQVTNTNCNNGQWVYLRVYDGQHNQLLEKYVGSSNVSAGQTIFDTTIICGRSVDTVYFRFEASNPFAYQFKYDISDTSENEIEPNNDFVSARTINKIQTKAGHIRYYANGGTDLYDYYKTVLPTHDTLKIMAQVIKPNVNNRQCVY